MDVPGDTLLRAFGMLAKVLEGEGAGGGIVFLVGEGCGLYGCFVLHAEPPVEDGEVVVRGEIVGVDGLDALIFCSRLLILVLLIEGEAEFTVGIARLRKLRCNLLKICDGIVDVSLIALDESEVIERAGIVFCQLEGLLQVGKSVVVFFPLDQGDGDVGGSVGVVGAEFCDVLEGVHAGGVLLRIEEGDAVVIPTHPLWIFVWNGLGGWVQSRGKGAGSAGHFNDGFLIVGALGHLHDEIDEVLIEAPVEDGGGDADGATGARHGEGIAHELRAA